MPQFTVDEDLARLVEKLANPKPFEHLTFNNSLRRVLDNLAPRGKGVDTLEGLVAESMALQKKEPKKLPSPSAQSWAATVPELKNKKALTNWKAICDVLKIDTAGDSARRKLKNWVRDNEPNWPAVPGVDGD